MYKKIFKLIKKYDNIVIARHIGPDPDCLASQIALRDIIKNTFNKKNVYAVGNHVSKFYYFGKLDKLEEDIANKSLLIILDTPDKERIDGVDFKKFKQAIKIDHHPFVENFCDLEFIDDKASSTSQMIMELCFNTKLKMTKEAAENLFMGLVSDTNRFMYYYTTFNTFSLVAKIMEKYQIDIEELYNRLYLRPLSEIRLQGYIGLNMTVTDNGLGYIKITNDIINQLGVDSASAGNMINNFNHIDGVLVWVSFAEDIKQNVIRAAIRSRGPIINEVAARYGGGGHKYASGARFKSFEDIEPFIEDLNKICQEYNTNNQK
jgi:bifunctional oligoribonuclease and PAP phosphatase NrnA